MNVVTVMWDNDGKICSLFKFDISLQCLFKHPCSHKPNITFITIVVTQNLLFKLFNINKGHKQNLN